MIKILQNYIQKKGREAIDEITTNAIEDPSTFIKTVTNMYKKLTDLVRVAFKDAQQFRNCLDKAFESFLNQNKLTKTYGSEKCVELLTKYCDNIGLAFGEFLGDFEIRDTYHKCVKSFLSQTLPPYDEKRLCSRNGRWTRAQNPI